MRVRVYPETLLSYNPQIHELSIQLPWIRGRLPLPRQVEIYSKRPGKKNVNALLSHEDFFTVSDIESFPFCHILPRPWSKKAEILKSQSFKLDMNRAEYLRVLEMPETLFNSIELFAENWLWDTAELRSCKAGSYYDPVSVYTACRRLRNLPQPYSVFSEQLFASLQNALSGNETTFFKHAEKLLWQSYYVTSHCCECLQPALGCSSLAERLSEYIKEENGHHRLIEKSIRELNPDFFVSDANFFVATKCMMALLRFTAQFHPVAFCCLISGFEQAGQYDEDPLALLFLRSSKPSAAKGILTHFKINKAGNHAEAGYHLIKDLPFCTREEAIASLRASELLNCLYQLIAFTIVKEMDYDHHV